MEFDFLKPIDSDVLDFIGNLKAQQLGSKVVLHTNDQFPDLDQVQIAIFGVLDNRGDRNAISEVDVNSIRKQFYSLFPGNWDASIADLGDIPAGSNVSDTYFAVKQIAAELIKKRIIPIVLGGSQDITYSLYRAYDTLEQMVNLVAVDAKFDFGTDEEDLSATSYLTKMIVEEPNNLFNYCNIGYQTYFNSQEEIDLIEKLYFDAYRLGEVSNNIAIAEPVFRDADMVSIDLNSVKSSDSGNTIRFQPNGFNGKEICALSRYAGISDKVSSFGIYNHNNTAAEAVLAAQVVWYFIEGFHYRSMNIHLEAKRII